MSTNNQSQRPRRGATDLAEVKRRRRLENLMYTRKRVTQLAAEYRSHGLDDHLDLYLLQIEVEQVISDEFPDVFKRELGLWADEEAAAEHHPLTRAESCALCQAITADRGRGTDTPAAA